ncbi:MAG: hypothetical protein D6B26_03145 [Spirochaetaceae bacterium]|nr:MAG: hypothetical protein D6B26_03145 [Spirochaetaceae bacterium]
MAHIGIKTADGGFFRICEEDQEVKKRVRLVPARENQTSVQIDLFRGDAASVSEAEYIGSLLLEQVEADEQGERKLDLILKLDPEGNMQATVTDLGSGSYQSFSVNLNSLDEAGGFDIPDFSLDDDQIDQVSVEGVHDDLDEMSFDAGMESEADDFERELEEGLLEDGDNIEPAADLPEPPRFDQSYDDRMDSEFDSYGEDIEDDDEEEPYQEVKKLHPLLIAGIVLILLAAIGLASFGVFLLLKAEATPPLQAMRSGCQQLIAWGRMIV